MRLLAYRVLSMGLRFGCPLLILASSTPTMMGSYYLFVTFFTFAVFLMALELAIPFSKQYLQHTSDRTKRQAFSGLVASELTIASLLALPAAALYFGSDSNLAASPMHLLLFGLALISETCVTEVGRFFWNIGQAETASRRDLLRSLGFVTAVLGSVLIDGRVAGAVSLVLILVFNVALLAHEHKHWGVPVGRLRLSRRRVRRMRLRVVHSVVESLPQVLHVQILSAIPLLERLLIERRLGLEAVGSYSFQYAVIQAGAGLLLLPAVATARQAILGASTADQWGAARRISLSLLAKIVTVASLFAVIAYLVIPLIAVTLKKDIASSMAVMVAALSSASMLTYSSAISPMYAQRGRILRANALTLGALLPLALCMSPAAASIAGSELAVMSLIAAVSVTQIALRVAHLVRAR